MDFPKMLVRLTTRSPSEITECRLEDFGLKIR